ncbi:MAG TPA: FKBP-type peptidyl-prolyl cis-trans isomerase [Solirubrobacteraceae bacterium]|jgi:peptidylprolyl isomerase|nr:FKBP-type peptidyl-prolyl cis-trans isomerase [Solirubrobacteraceae bacterium]
MRLKAVTTAVAAAAVALGIAACGGSTKAGGIMLAPGEGATVEAPTTTTPTATTVSTPKTGALSKEPTITLPKTPAPKTLVEKNLIVGTGATAAAGDEVEVNYVGELYSNGKVFDSSWKDTPGKAFGPFQLGAGAVIKGWDQGLVGMKVGGRRELIIPPSLGYGKAGSGSTIPPNATLIFVVDLLSVSK